MEYDKFYGLIAPLRIIRIEIKKHIPKELLTINRAINQVELNQL